MSFTLRNLAGTAVLAVAASALTLPLAPAASAVGPVERVWTLGDSDADGSYGLWFRDVPGGTLEEQDESTVGSFSELGASSDGSRLAYVRDTETRSQVVVRDISGNVVRTVVDLPSNNSLLFEPALSPNGNTVAWTEITFSPFSIKLRKASVLSGAPSTVLTSYGLLGFLDDNTLLVQNTVDGLVKTTPVSGGALTSPSGFPQEAGQVTVSSGGTKVAWAEDTTGSGADTAEIHVGSLANNAGTWTVTGDATLSTTLNNLQPSFSRDGATVYWVQNDGDGGLGEVLSRPFDASSAATTLAATPDDEIDAVVTELPSADVTPPSAATALAATLNGTAATLRVSLPADADRSGVVVKRYLGTTATGTPKIVFVPAAVTAYPEPTGLSYGDTGLTLGATYTYTFTTVDRSGNGATPAERSLTALQAAPTSADPTSLTSATASFPVTFGPSGPVSAHWFVDYLPIGTTTWKTWVTDLPGRTRTFGAPAAPNVLATTSTPGANYVFRAKAQDAFGNSTPVVSSARAVVPYDQTKAVLYGGTTTVNSSAYLGSYRRLWKTTDYAKVNLVGNRLQVVGLRCTTCGQFAIYDGSTLIGVVDTYAASTQLRRVLFTRTYSSVGTHYFTIRPKATSGRPNVMLDGFAMRR